MTEGRPPDPRIAIALALGAFGMFTMMDTIIKWQSQSWPIQQIILCNAAAAMLPLIAWSGWRGRWSLLRTRRPGLHVIRGLIGLTAAYGAFWGYSRLSLPDAYTINFTAPLMITALSVPILGERVGWRRWSAVVVGFGGVMIMLDPGAGMLDAGALGVFVGALGYATSMLIVRRFGAGESNVSFAFYTFLTQSAVMLPIVLYDPVIPRLGDLAMMACSGLIAGVALLMLTTAFLKGAAAIVAPFQYSQLLWGTIAGWLVWGDLPSGRTLAGAAIVVASGLYILHRESRLRAG